MTEYPLSRFAAARWKARYGELTDPEIAAVLRGWSAWRAERIAQHPDVAVQIEEVFGAATVWLRQEAARRLAPPVAPDRRMTTEQLLARHGDRMKQTGPDRWRAACPWHGDSRPSLVVFADGHCHCFACGEHRPVADLAREWGKKVTA